MITKEELKELGVSMTSFARDLAIYLGEDYDSAFYQHIGRVLNGEVKPTPQEDEASDKWLKVHQNPHHFGVKYFDLVDTKRAMIKLRSYMRSGVYNQTQIDRSFKKIIDLMS